MNSPDLIRGLATILKDRGIVPELEVFDNGTINYAKYLAKKNLIEPPYYFNLLLGNVACAQADLLHTGIMINDLPKNSFWSLAGIGDTQLKMNSLAIAVGGGVRVGLEDNIWYDTQRTKLATNLDLIQRILSIAQANSRKIMTPKEFRGLMQTNPGNGSYGREFNVQARS